MPCQPYKDTLVQTAASGAQPAAELRAHLAVCSDCRSAFALEQSLFTSIDSGLRLTANAEVPASLLPRIRARLDEAPAPARFWSSNWLVFASAAALLLASFTAYSLLRTRRDNPPPNNALMVSPSTSPKSSQPSLTPSPSAPDKKPFTSSTNAFVASAPVLHPRPTLTTSTPEVIVSHGEELLLTSYAQQWRNRKQPLLLAKATTETDFPFLQVSPIQITELDVKPLVEGKSQ